MKPRTIQFYRNRGGWQILLPQLADPVANTVTTRANQMGATNIISSAHYPINGVLEIYETDSHPKPTMHIWGDSHLPGGNDSQGKGL